MISSLSEITQLWGRALKKIEERLGEKHVFDSFFSDTYIYEIRGDKIVVVAGSELAANLLSNRYYDVIADVISDLTESNFKLEFITEKDIEKPEVSVQPQQKRAQYFSDAVINPNLTFDNFVVGSFNKEANQASLIIASNPGKMFNPLFIHSDSGLGKTHLLHAVGNYIQKISKPNAKILYIHANDFVDEYIKFARGERDAEDLKSYMSEYDVLLFDDVQFLANKVKSQDMFFFVYEKLYNSGKQIVITSDKQPAELNGLQDRLVTRFSKGLTVKIDSPDRNTCVEILKKKIESSGLDINKFDDDVLEFFADKFSKDIRELEGALNRLIFFTVSMKQTDRVTLDVATEAVASLIGGKTSFNQPSEQKVINLVADYYNIPVNQLTGKIRTGQVALARHIAMYLIRTEFDTPFDKIGQLFGGRDHSSVMSAIKKVENMLKTDSELNDAVEELKKRLHN